MNTQLFSDAIQKRGYPVKPSKELALNVLKLETRLLAIFKMRFDRDGNVAATYREIGKHFKVSPERARQLIEKALWIIAGKPE